MLVSSDEGKNKRRESIVPWPVEFNRKDRTNTAGKRSVTCRQFDDLTRFIRRLCRTGLLVYTDEEDRNGIKGKRILWSGITMLEVSNNVVKPIIEYHNVECSWSTFVNDEDVEPEIFISHSWQQKYRDFVSNYEHLKEGRGLTATSRVWICTFANNQFEVQLGKSLHKSPFHEALKYCKQVALFLDPTASALKRSWCNFELSICIDTPELRKFWEEVQKVFSEQSQTEKKCIKKIALEAMENPEMRPLIDKIDIRPLLFITPAGQVGTARVTSGRVLNALQGFKSCEAEAYGEPDRRRIMNHIAYNFLKEKTDAELKESEVKGLTEKDGKLVLADTEKSKSDRKRYGLGEKKKEYEYEEKLFTNTLDQFNKFDMSISILCEKELNRHMLRPAKKTGSSRSSRRRRDKILEKDCR